MAAEKTVSRVPVAFRLPPEEAREVERYARTHELTKTEAFVRLLRKGIEADRSSREQKQLDEIQRSLDRILALLGKERSAQPSLGDVSDAVANAAQEFPAVRRAYVFGSYARGEATPDSDLDVRIEIDHNEAFSLYDLARLQKAIERASGKSVDIVTAETIKNKHLAQAIEKEKVIVYDRENQ